MAETTRVAEKGWVMVDVDGNLHSLTRGDRAGRVEKRGDHYDAKVGRRRAGPPRYWSWEGVGRFDTVAEARRAVEARLPRQE